MRHLSLLLAALATASALALAGCATPPGSGHPLDTPHAPLGTVWPDPPTGEVIAQGTVLDAGHAAELCLGAVMESYPPQCRGIPLANWSWDEARGSESSGDVIWGAYAVQGTFDGHEFTVTEPPIMLALYDPLPFPDPTNGKPGAGEEFELLAIQEELTRRLGEALLSSWPENGWLWVDVVWDDGMWQEAADAEFGDSMVVIRSAMRPVSAIE